MHQKRGSCQQNLTETQGESLSVLRCAAADAEGKDICVLPIGRRAVEHYERRGIPIVSKAF